MFAEVDMDQTGAYHGHRITQAGYICLGCGAPAVDLGEVPAAMEEDRQEELQPVPVDVLCPHCETLVSVLPDSDCPNCGLSLETASPS